MSRATTAGLSRSGKAKTVRTLLAVICGKKTSRNHTSDYGVENDRKSEKHANGRVPSESRSNNGQFQHEFADLETSGYLEVGTTIWNCSLIYYVYTLNFLSRDVANWLRALQKSTNYYKFWKR